MQGIPIIVENVLNDYIALVNERLPNMLEGVYIQGSIALNAYVKDSSDIDFITVTNRRLVEEEAEVLSEIHSRIAEKYKNPEMDGVYIIWEDHLGELDTDDSVYPFYNSGKLSYGDYLNPIT
jgi:predicted nucleotidyltransferase